MHKIQRLGGFNLFIVVLLVLALFGAFTSPLQAADNSRYFPQTNHTVSGKFLDYWEKNGGLAVYGYPITDPQMEVDPETGKTFLTQWFERNRFELHPENAGTRYEVLLGLLGKDLRREALTVDPDFAQAANLTDPTQPLDQQSYFPQTGHNLRFGFLKYWQQNGGLERFGFPISEEHQEVDPETGKVFTMQWFERARFEYHPENAGTKYEILLGLLGKQIKTPNTKIDFSWHFGQDRSNPQTSFYNLTLDHQGNFFVVNEVAHEVEKLNSAGQLLLKWGSKGNGDGQFADREAFPRNSIALDSQGNVYITDDGNRRVQKFDSTGRFLLKWGSEGSGDGQFKSVKSLAVDSLNNVYVTDPVNNRVQKFDSTGRFLLKWGSSGKAEDQFTQAENIAVDAQNNLYVVDQVVTNVIGVSRGGVALKKFDSNGRFLKNLGGLNSWSVGGLSLDSAGNIYVFSYRGCPGSCPDVMEFNSNGEFQNSLFEEDNISGMIRDQVGGLLIDKQGNFYLGGANFIQKYDKNRKILGKILTYGEAPSQFNLTSNLAVDHNNNVYVIDKGSSRIKKFDNRGQPLLTIGARFGSDVGAFSDYLTSLTVDESGAIYVLDAGNGVIQKFDSSGKFVKRWSAIGEMIASDAQDNIYLLSNSLESIEKFDSNGKFIVSWKTQTTANNMSEYVDAITVDQQGHVFALVTNLNLLKEFDSAGNLIAEWTNLSIAQGDLSGKYSLAVDSQGNVYIQPAYRSAIYKFDKTGNLITRWENKTSQPDGLFAPQALAVDANRNLFVTDGAYLYKFIQP